MTADGIRITTQAQADAVPNYSRGLWPDDPNQWFVTPAAPRGYLATNTYMLTHVAMPVDRAAADRDEAFADAKVLRNAWDALSRGAVNAIADRVEARARRTLPDTLADAYRAQQDPELVVEPVDAHTVKITVPQGDGSTASFTVPTAPLRAALDAERGQE